MRTQNCLVNGLDKYRTDNTIRRIVLDSSRKGVTIMPFDYSQDIQFRNKCRAAEDIIYALNAYNIADARRLVDRYSNWNRLQGHIRALLPFAVWLIQRHPQILAMIRGQTNLGRRLQGRESNAAVWAPIRAFIVADLATDGNDIIAPGVRANSPQTPSDIARTYLSGNVFGGGQPNGGAGDVTLKIVIKILANVLP